MVLHFNNFLWSELDSLFSSVCVKYKRTFIKRLKRNFKALFCQLDFNKKIKSRNFLERGISLRARAQNQWIMPRPPDLSEVEFVGPDKPEPVEGEEDEQDDEEGDGDLVKVTNLQIGRDNKQHSHQRRYSPLCSRTSSGTCAREMPHIESWKPSNVTLLSCQKINSSKK